MQDEDFSACTAMVVDGNVNSRSVLVSQLRDLGIPQVVQCIRTADARRQLEAQHFDFVLCEQNFADETTSGQELLDDLRRNHLLPFATVFIMITGEATYLKVAEAAESALDGYLLKPHKATHLEERLLLARKRKRALQEIFDTIDAQDFARAADLCLERFHGKGPFWLYAARIGAELLLRLERYEQAQDLYRSVVAAKTLPWAKLGIARSQLDAGQTTLACSTLEKLVGEDPEFADAYDVLGRALFEQGHFDRALSTYRMAAALTPSSISRLQSAAMMTFYKGDFRDAERLLDRTTRLGLESKLFDAQTLVLLALTRLDLQDRRGLQRCLDDFARLSERNADNTRIQRLAHFTQIIASLQRQDQEEVLAAMAPLAWDIKDAEFDLESATNMVAVLTQMRVREMHFVAAENVIRTIALRFCSSRPVTEMLASCALAHAPYAEWIRAAQNSVLAQSEAAVAQVLAGQLDQGIGGLLEHAQATLNVRLIDNAYQLLLKHQDRLYNHAELLALALELRRQAGAGNRKLSLGRQLRQPGGVVLRSSPRVHHQQTPASPGWRRA